MLFGYNLPFPAHIILSKNRKNPNVSSPTLLLLPQQVSWASLLTKRQFSIQIHEYPCALDNTSPSLFTLFYPKIEEEKNYFLTYPNSTSLAGTLGHVIYKMTIQYSYSYIFLWFGTTLIVPTYLFLSKNRKTPIFPHQP